MIIIITLLLLLFLGKYLGGRDDTIAWCKNLLSFGSENPSAKMLGDGYAKDHGFEYDIVGNY